MDGIKIESSNEKETIFTINDNIKITIVAENFNKDGEMIVEYDEETMDKDDVTTAVNSYFENLVEYLEKRDKDGDPISLKEKTGDAE